MNYKDIYNSYLKDFKSKNCNFTEKGLAICEEIKLKLANYLNKTIEMELLENLENKLEYYTTIDYTSNYRGLRKKIIYKLGEIVEIANEIERLLYSLEKEKI